MRVVARSTIDKFIKKHPDSKSSLESWLWEAKKNTWTTSSAIKDKYPSASFIQNNHVIFNIKGNSYRLFAKIEYTAGVVYIKWIGTHAEYDKRTFP